ncbi:MAG: RsmB/NOP family class I SAM-dependent RNA methyltransferase [Elainellaceae cyanobacterium]
MRSPSKLLVKFSRKLFDDEVQREQFIAALTTPQPLNPCILWCHDPPNDIPFAVEAPQTWQPKFVDRLGLHETPGRHPWHDEGYFYCLDFSSVFAASILQAIASPIRVVFDMCASPGGKSVFAWRLFQPDLLLSNEVIGKRMGALISNLKRCQSRPAIALSLDSKIVAEDIPHASDLVMVDAPCTGQSLLVKGIPAPGCFHPVTINKNANRQKRILANSARLVAPHGYLAYTTCAYSPDENEGVSQWFLERFPMFQPVDVPMLSRFQSHLTDVPCYRMLPQSGLGAGAFTTLFQNIESGDRRPIPESFLENPRLKFL